MAWPGLKCVAPSVADECEDAPPADAVVVQSGGNLGERIQHVNEELIGLGFERPGDFIISTTQQPVPRPPCIDGVSMASSYTQRSRARGSCACRDRGRMM